MAEHTPGPWRVVGRGNWRRIKTVNPVQLRYKSGTPRGEPRPVGVVSGPVAMTEADARLIAAAPELLEACAAMLSTWYSDDEDAIIAARNAARVAIAAATGTPERTPMPRP